MRKEEGREREEEGRRGRKRDGEGGKEGEQGGWTEETRQKISSMQLTSLQSGDIYTDSPPTGISVLGRHSILTTHKHHVLCE